VKYLFLSVGLLSLLLRSAVGQEAAEEANQAEAAPRVQSSAELTQREIDRRREATFRLNENLDLAERLYQAGEWEHAQAKFRLVMNQTDPQTATSGFYHRARTGVAKSLAAQAFAQEKKGNMAEAAGLMKQAADLDPSNAAVAKQAASYQEEAGRTSDPFDGNPAATADLVAKTQEIKKLLSLADQLTETGQYRSARKKLDDVLRIDPYNLAARKKIEAVEQKRLLLADKRYDASRVKAMTQVTEAWVPPPPARVGSKQTRATGSAGASNAAEILQALSSIEIPELVFNEKPVRAAVEELQRLSEQNDPKKRGINFVLRLPPTTEGSDPEAATISLELRNVKLQTALKYLCDQIRGGDKLRYDVENSAVFILPVTETGGELQIRSYNLPPSLLANIGKSGMTPKELGALVLESIGVNTTVVDSSATCFSDTGKLVVRNTPNELNKIEQRIRDAQGEPPQKQFEVETKFLSFSENDVKNFTFNYNVALKNGGIPIPGAPNTQFLPAQATSVAANTSGLRGTGGINPGGGSITALQALLDPTYPQDASNQIGVNSQVFGRGFAAVLQLLQNAIGKDLVAAPRVTLADGKQSKIVISRQMYYPTTYTQPTVPNNDQGVGAGFILPANPTGFDFRNIGTTLEVKGESTSIPKAVDLDFTNLLVEDFEGFVDYGAQIATVTQGGLYATPPTTTPSATQNLGSAPYLVPIFTKKSLQSRVRLIDGETVGMGGLISDTVQLVDDKVPMLGDIPMLGRLFRSEASQKIKSNLVIFCTIRIINPDGSLVFPEDEENPEFAQGGSSEMMPSVP
jgi:general secretion pathway protein D